MPIAIRSATDDDRERLHELGQRGFSARPAPYDPERDRAGVPLSRRLIASDGEHVVGKLATWDLGQWFGGRRVPMGGVAGVVVEPVARGRGVASALLRAAVEQMRSAGEVLAALYPMNHTLYRRHGWEVAGAYPEHEIPADVLAGLPREQRPVRLRTATPDDLNRIIEVHDAQSASEPGQLSPGRGFAANRLLPRAGTESYVAEVDGVVAGAVGFGHDASVDGREMYALTVTHLVAVDHDAELALWRLLGAHHPAARTVRYVAPMTTTLPHLIGEREVRAAADGWTWMLRLVDAAAAVAARGFPASVNAEVHLDIVDDLAPWNSGAHVLRVRDGVGTLEPGGAGRVRIGAGHLASVYSGWADPRLLARWRLLDSATEQDVDALAAAFTSRTPWMRYFF